MNNSPNTFAIAIALGPVGRFISAGRRSRDLWYGSRLLSELTRQAACFLKESKKVELWTPLPEHVSTPYFDLRNSDMRPHEGPVIANKIRATLEAPNVAAVKEILQETEAHVRAWLCSQLQDIRTVAAKDSTSLAWKEVGVHPRTFMDQVDAIRLGDFVEFYAGVAQVTPEQDELSAMRRAQTLRDARKNSRLFVGPSWTQAGHMRSSLEPGRDSVLIQYDPREDPEEGLKVELARNTEGIRPDERLDAIGLVRRFAAIRESNGNGYDTNTQEEKLLPGLPFPPLSRVAADPWLEGVKHHTSLTEIVSCLKDLEWKTLSYRHGALHLISSPSLDPGQRPGKEATRRRMRESGTFPYDASLLFEGGLEALSKDLDRFKQPADRSKSRPNAIGDARTALKSIEPHVRALHKERLPQHYYAYLTADGDGIGQALSKLISRDEETKLVTALGQFAQQAWKIVGETHRGTCFYVGADELCAYLPLDEGLPAARELAECFQQHMQESTVEAAQRLTLSVGMVVAHVKHDLRDIRHRGEEALKQAKHRRRREDCNESFLEITECVAGAADRHCGGVTQALVDRIQKDWRPALARATLNLAQVHRLLGELDALRGVENETVIVASLQLALAGPGLSLKRQGGRDEPGQPDLLLTALQELQKGLNATGDAPEQTPAQLVRSTRDLCNEILLANRIQQAAQQRAPSPSTGKESTR